MRRFLPLTLVIAFLAGLFALPAPGDYTLVRAPKPEDAMPATIYQLDNGLMVYLTEYHEEPRFYAEIAVRAGSKQDPAEATGLAHYLEHLLFKGSTRLGALDYEREAALLDYIADLYELHFYETDPEKRLALYAQINTASAEAARLAVPNELDRLYQLMGGTQLNAHTWHEETVYKVSLPNNRVRQWAALESDRFEDPVFRLFQTELETVYEEMNRALDNKSRIITYAVNETLFKEHPYGQQPTLGLPEHLKNPSIRHIQQYYDTYYVPNNMAIFISGDIDPEETIAIIDEYFSVWEAKPLPEPQTWEEPALEGREYVERRYEGEEFALLAFRTAPQGHEDAEPLRMLDMILDNATAGLINLELNQKQRVQQAGSYPALYNDHGAQYLWGIPKEGQTLEEVESLLLAQVDRIRKGDFDESILPAILRDFQKTKERQLEDNTARVSLMRESFLAFEDWERSLGMLDRMAAVTKDDVVRVANTYFSRGYVAGYRIDAPHEVPEIEKPELATLEIDPTKRSAFAEEIAAMAVEDIAPAYVDPATDYQRVEMPKGRVIYHAPNPVNSLYSFSITVETGTHHDNALALATRLLDKAGAGDLSAEALKTKWYGLGVDFSIGAGDNETTITLSGLDENFGEALALLAQVLSAPHAEAATLDEMKAIVLKEREDAKKQADSLHRALMLYHRHGDESPYLKRLSAEELNALTVEQLLGKISGLLGYKHTVMYTGTLPLETVQAKLAEHLPVSGPLADTPPYHFLEARQPEQTQIWLVDKEGATANVRLEFGSVDYAEGMTAAVQLYNEYFSGGMAGVVFQELREARALAYSAGARYLQGERVDDQNLMLAAIQTQADKTPEATAAFIELLDNLPQSEERFTAAHNAMINLYRTGRVDFRALLNTVRGWKMRGLEPDPREPRFAVIQQAQMPLMLDFHAENIKGKPKLISIVGEKARIDMEALEQIAPVTEVSVDQLFRD